MAAPYAPRSPWAYPDLDQPDGQDPFGDWWTRPNDPDVMKETVKRVGDPDMRYDPETRALQRFGTRPDGYLGFYPLTADQERAAKQQAFGGASAAQPEAQPWGPSPSSNAPSFGTAYRGAQPFGAAFNDGASRSGSIRDNPDFRPAARAALAGRDGGGPDGRFRDAATPAFLRDLQSDSGDAHASNPLLVKTGGSGNPFKFVEGIYDAINTANTVKDGINASLDIAENNPEYRDVASKGQPLNGGRWWMAGVQREPGWANSEFAWVVVTDDGFSLARYLEGKPEFDRLPPPVALRTPENDEWSDPVYLANERDRLIRERGSWGKLGKWSAGVVTGLLFPGAAGKLNDFVQWATDGKGGRRTGTYSGFTAEKASLIRQAAIEARIAQLRYRQAHRRPVR